MNQVRKLLGPLWMLLGPLSIYFLVRTAYAEVAQNASADVIIQWGVFVVVALPIAAGLMIFGWYAWKDEYKR